jgi:AcrR family transcriptional regulator
VTNETRRSPTGESRQRDAERTKRAILEAAGAEFAQYGYAGARVSRIADRAGVNKQLISYYFGGKQGLLEAVDNIWWDRQPTLYPADVPLAEVAANYVRASAANPDGMRLLIWEALGDGSGYADDTRTEWMQRFVEDIKVRQGTGEMPAGVDPRVIGLVMFAAAAAPVAFAPIAAAMGLSDAENGDWYAEQVAVLIRALGNTS